MAFDAFISYSHAADGKLAPALQRGLQQLAEAVEPAPGAADLP